MINEQAYMYISCVVLMVLKNNLCFLIYYKKIIHIIVTSQFVTFSMLLYISYALYNNVF